MLNKALIVALLFVSNVSAGTVVQIVPGDFPTAVEARKETVDRLIRDIERKVENAIFDGEFQIKAIVFEDRLSQDVEAAITNRFLNAGYTIQWDFDEKTKEARLIISWR